MVLEEDVELENPLLIEGLAGIGHVGRNCVSYIADQLDAEQIGTINSTYFPPYTLVNDDKSLEPLRNKVYKVEIDGRDAVMVEGNAQAGTAHGHHEVAYEILDKAEELGVTEIITIGGYGTGEVVEDPDVYASVSDAELKDRYDSNYSHDVDQIVGISGLLLGLGKDRGFEGLALLGETPGFLLSDPKATEAVLKELEGLLGFELDYSNLEEKAEESEQVLKKLQSLKQDKEDQQQQGGADLGYIG